MATNSTLDLVWEPPITGTVTGTVQVSGLTIAGLVTIVSIDNTKWWALPPTAQPKRNSLTVQNLSGVDILINFDPLAPLANGYLVYNNGSFNIDVTNNIPVYGTTVSGSGTVTVVELA